MKKIIKVCNNISLFLNTIFRKNIFSTDFSKIVFTSVVVNLGILSIIVGILYNYRNSISFFDKKGDTTLVYQKNTEVVNTPAPEVVTPPSIADIVEKVSPSVVAITLYQIVPIYETYTEQQEVYGLPGFYMNIPKQRQIGTKKQEIGGGSGFFISNDGLIVTNRHVAMSDAVTYVVTTQNGKTYDARVVGRDTETDIALLKIQGTNFKKLNFINSKDIVVGQSVIAIGNVLAQFKNSVSVGIISGLGRSIKATDNQGNVQILPKVIQTDTAINPGNSGGPLINLQGDVVGVNVATVSGGQNIGFALPVDIVQAAIKRLGK